MPITYRIDHERRIVVARGYGTFTDDDVFNYQREVWSGKDVIGFDELIDMTDVAQIELPSTRRVQDLATIAAHMDLASAPSRFAIVAPGDLAYGLGRQYQAHRGGELRSSKEVGVFRSLSEALVFLRINEAPPFPPLPPDITNEK